MQRAILHSDLNNFYASVECLSHPELNDKPVVVGGDPEMRHGIVLAKNQLAKATGIQTGEALWIARQRCPGLVVVPPHFPRYLEFAQQVREIYGTYTDRVEPFGLDEAWLDVTGSRQGSGEAIAQEIRRRVKRETGLTVSVGVSFNKVFAKLGSDMKKPDAVTVITRENYRERVWPLPVEDLLYVGPATAERLHRHGILTIGNLAACDDELLHSLFGRTGPALALAARGLDESPVALADDDHEVIKSVGNSTTTPRDLVCDEDARLVLLALSESVAARLREQGLRCSTVQISVRENDLTTFERQTRLTTPTNVSGQIAAVAMELLRANYRWTKPIRSLGVRGTDLTPADAPRQMDLFGVEERQLRRERLEQTLDSVRQRYGTGSILRASLMGDLPLAASGLKTDPILTTVGLAMDGS